MKQFILIALYIFISLGIQAKNKLVIVVNPKTCRYCLHTISGTNTIDSAINKTLYFKTDINTEQIDYFISKNFPKTFTNYQIIQNDSLVDYYNSFDKNYIIKGMVAVVNDSNNILTHFNLEYIAAHFDKINWLCKTYQAKASIKTIPEIKPLIDFYTISKSDKNLVISGYGEALFVFDNNLKLKKEINFNTDSICTWFYRQLHETDIWLNYFLSTSRDLKTYAFMQHTIYKNKVIFPFVFDSAYIQYDTGYLPPKYFLGTYYIEKDSLAIERIREFPNPEKCYVSSEYMRVIDDNTYRFKLTYLTPQENQPAFGNYKRVKNGYEFIGFEKATINTTLSKNSIAYPSNIYINEECIIQYKNMTYESLIDHTIVKLQCKDFEDAKKRHSSMLHCTRNNDLIKLTAIDGNQLVIYCFNLKGVIVNKNTYNLGTGLFKISSNTVSNSPNEYHYINSANELVTITVSEYN